jgi:hypothetical protein
MFCDVLVNGSCDWLMAYKADHSEHLRSDPTFAQWLETEYVPIAGGWQY